MLKKVDNLSDTNPAYKYVGIDKDTGYKEYLVDIKENKNKNKTVSNLDDALIDCDEFPDEFYSYDWKETFNKVVDENKLTENDFYKMDFKTIQYHIYK